MENGFWNILNIVFNELKDFVFFSEDENLKNDFFSFMINNVDENFDIKSLEEPDIKRFFQDFFYNNEYLPSKDTYLIEYYLEKNPDISPENKEMLIGIKNKRSSAFEIKDKQKDKFELYRMTSNVNYTAYFTGKLSKCRDFLKGGYIIASIIKYFDKYYILEITGYVPSTEKSYIILGCSLELTKHPYSFFEDNTENLEKAEKMVQQVNKAFKDHFKTDFIITTNEIADEIHNELGNVIEGEPDNLDNIIIEKPETFGYIEYKEGEEDFFGDEECFEDTGLFIDEELGLFLLPAYGTFFEIFKTEDHKKIKGWDDLIYRYFQDTTIPPSAILNVYNDIEDKKKFLDIIKNPLGYDDEILDINLPIKEYKRIYLEEKMISSAVIFLISDVLKEFTEIEDVLVEEEAEKEIEKVGRNDPCPCGSGKKYKKCCLK